VGHRGLLHSYSWMGVGCMGRWVGVGMGGGVGDVGSNFKIQ
jgi:hypothetical protein